MLSAELSDRSAHNGAHPLSFGLRARYYGDTPITLNGSFDEEVYTERIEAALRFYHDTDRYWKQAHYMNWLTQCLQHHEKGVFLLQADSGTGKSTFPTIWTALEAPL